MSVGIRVCHLHGAWGKWQLFIQPWCGHNEPSPVSSSQENP